MVSNQASVIAFDPKDVAAACNRHAADLRGLPDHIDGPELLWALAGNESNYGRNCKPRHEPAYDVGGMYSHAPEQAALLTLFGSAGACSYGPLQVMLVNAPVGYAPSVFDDLDHGIAAGVYTLNTLIARHKPQTVTDIACCYNAGHIIESGKMSPGVARYVATALLNYGNPHLPLHPAGVA